MCDYKIYDNENDEFIGISFADYEDAEDHVIYVLQDADFERYSIYHRLCGK